MSGRKTITGKTKAWKAARREKKRWEKIMAHFRREAESGGYWIGDHCGLRMFVSRKIPVFFQPETKRVNPFFWRGGMPVYSPELAALDPMNPQGITQEEWGRGVARCP